MLREQRRLNYFAERRLMLRDKMSNTEIHEGLNVEALFFRNRNFHLRWFVHVIRMFLGRLSRWVPLNIFMARISGSAVSVSVPCSLSEAGVKCFCLC